MSRLLTGILTLAQASIASNEALPAVQAIKVEIVGNNGKYKLLRGGQPVTRIKIQGQIKGLL